MGGKMGAGNDKQAIDALTRAFFGVFSNRDCKRAELDVLYELCLAEAVIIKTCADAPTIYNLRQFITVAKLAVYPMLVRLILGRTMQLDAFWVNVGVLIACLPSAGNIYVLA